MKASIKDLRAGLKNVRREVENKLEVDNANNLKQEDAGNLTAGGKGLKRFERRFNERREK